MHTTISNSIYPISICSFTIRRITFFITICFIKGFFSLFYCFFFLFPCSAFFYFISLFFIFAFFLLTYVLFKESFLFFIASSVCSHAPPCFILYPYSLFLQLYFSINLASKILTFSQDKSECKISKLKFSTPYLRIAL